MNNQLQIFKNEEFGQIRVVDMNNEPWFIAIDICKALDLSNPTVAVQRLDEDERAKFNLGRQGEINIVNEYGLYNLILASRKPEAKKFKRWVTHEVIPSIRKHGAYMTDEIIEKTLTDPDFIIKLATQLKEERQKRLEAERLTNQIAVSENSLLVREVAKIASKRGIIIGEKRLWNKLREWGLVFKNSTEPKQEYVDRGYFEVVEGTTETSKGIFIYRTTKVTGKGQVYIIKRLLEESMNKEVVVSEVK
ncbi:phage antirepressor [Tepidimicrobium xylanilyticum]